MTDGPLQGGRELCLSTTERGLHRDCLCAGRFFFDEVLGPVCWAGILIICLGVYLVTRSV
ncbi:MAG: hypothetical protein ACKVE3_05870 [Dissulfuribacterales bacterium]